MHYDAVVVGLGAMGSAAVYQLAKAGAAVLGIDRYAPPHQLGSTHGDTRITRLAIGEGPEYVPLVMRSHQIWRELETQVDDELLVQCGGLVMAGEHAQNLHGSGDFLKQTVASADRYGIDHELLTAEQIGGRFPPFNLSGSESAYFEPAAGYVRPERCVDVQLRLARRLGAEIRLDDEVLSYADNGDGVTVVTCGAPVTADKVVIAAGPWVSRLVPELETIFTVHRQVLFWFDLEDRAAYNDYRDLPIYIWEFGDGTREQFIYGFPMIDGPDGGAKVATEDYTSATTPEAARHDVTNDEVDAMYVNLLRDRLPGLSGRCVKTSSCLYTVTPDSGFVIDVHPSQRNVLVASPCSGHGFKHSAAIGEVLAQLVTKGRSDIDISAFSLQSRTG